MGDKDLAERQGRDCIVVDIIWTETRIFTCLSQKYSVIDVKHLVCACLQSRGGNKFGVAVTLPLYTYEYTYIIRI